MMISFSFFFLLVSLLIRLIIGNIFSTGPDLWQHIVSERFSRLAVTYSGRSLIPPDETLSDSPKSFLSRHIVYRIMKNRSEIIEFYRLHRVCRNSNV